MGKCSLSLSLSLSRSRSLLRYLHLLNPHLFLLLHSSSSLYFLHSPSPRSLLFFPSFLHFLHYSPLLPFLFPSSFFSNFFPSFLLPLPSLFSPPPLMFHAVLACQLREFVLLVVEIDKEHVVGDCIPQLIQITLGHLGRGKGEKV